MAFFFIITLTLILLDKMKSAMVKAMNKIQQILDNAAILTNNFHIYQALTLTSINAMNLLPSKGLDLLLRNQIQDQTLFTQIVNARRRLLNDQNVVVEQRSGFVLVLHSDCC